MVPLIRSPAPLAFTLLLLLVALAPLGGAGEGQGGTRLVLASTRSTLGFHVQGDRVVGTLVSFTYASDAGPVKDFAYRSMGDGSLQPAPIFQSVSVPAYRGVGVPSIEGGRFSADGGVASLTVHDSPTALLQIVARGPIQVTFSLAPGAAVESGDSETSHAQQCVALDKPTRGAIFSPDGSMVVQGDQVVATLPGPGMVLFRAVPPDGQGTPGDERAVCEAIAQRRVAAEVDIQLLDDGPRVESLPYRADAYVEVTSVSKRHLELRIVGTRPEGTRLFLRLDPSVATAADARNLKVTLDNVPVSSGSLTDVLYARGANPPDARYHALVQGPGLGLLTYIPQLSSVGVALIVDAPGPYHLDLPTLEVLGVGVAVVALATLALFRRRK